VVLLPPKIEQVDKEQATDSPKVVKGIAEEVPPKVRGWMGKNHINALAFEQIA